MPTKVKKVLNKPSIALKKVVDTYMTSSISPTMMVAAFVLLESGPVM
jgi:hypothetical protein